MKNELELIFDNDVAYADSRVIARYFGKRHSDVLRDIRNMLKVIGNERDFASVYKDVKGEERICYKLPFDETMTLITGYDVKLRHKIVQQWYKLLKERTEARMYAKGIRHSFTDTLKSPGYEKQYEYINTTKAMKKTLEITARK